MTEHKAVIMGQIHREHFVYVSYLGNYRKQMVFDRFEKFWEGNINTDNLVKGDHIFIDELNMKVKIINRVVSTNGIVTYETDHSIRTEENKRTIESFKIAQMRKKMEDDFTMKSVAEAKRIKKEVEEELNSLEEHKPKKSWFERVFG